MTAWRWVIVASLAAAAGWPAAGEEPARPNVVLITLDGVRTEEVFGGLDETILQSVTRDGTITETDAFKRFAAGTPAERRRKLLPFFWGTLMERHGGIAGNRALGSTALVRNSMRFSYPGYAELLTGAARDRTIDSNDNRRNPHPTVLEIVRRELKLKPTEVATFGSWETFRWIAESQEGATTVNAGPHAYEHPDPVVAGLSAFQFEAVSPWKGVRVDAFTMRFARAHLERFTPRLLYVALDETDDWSHDRKYELVLDRLHRFDAALGDLWTWLQAHPRYRDQTTLIVTTDHGRGHTPKDWSSHGKDTEGAQVIWIACAGRGVTRRGEWRDAAPVYQAQVAATVAASLGVDFRTHVPEADAPIPACVTP